MLGPLKKEQEKVPKSKAIKSTNKDVLFGHSNQASIAAGCGKKSLVRSQSEAQFWHSSAKKAVKTNLQDAGNNAEG